MSNPIPSAEALAELPPDGGPEWNRLVFERSPYLLQHAANPVDWWPWGDAAFEEARRRGVAVFLSIGYSTCHWCHVMERESFEDGEVAALLNEHFVCVKVDREERPDVDHVYMAYTQALTGSGGWPMTVFLTPDKLPFYAGTYFPKRGRLGRPGMMELVPELARHFRESRAEIEASGPGLVEHLARASSGGASELPGAAAIALGFEQLSASFDEVYGGFLSPGGANKFPVPHQLMLLLRHHRRTGSERALEMVERTLDGMRRGGLFDHVGYGFHRYSTDRQWLLPHFEKMLYDQALLALAYLEAYQVTGEERHAATAREVFTYVLRDMTAPEGGFYSAEDADSEGEEGRFNTWTPEEVVAVLGAEEGELFSAVYAIVPDGNFAEQATGERTGRSIPHLARPLEELAEELGHEPDALAARLEASRARLFAAREARVHPLKDDKVLTDWNGLMIAALARGSRVLADPSYERAAARAAEFALAQLVTEEGRLLKRWRLGEAAFPAVLDDHADLLFGLLELHDATYDPRWLASAASIAEVMIAHFADEERGGFYLTADDGEALLVRPREVYDGALPSGNSVAAYALLRLGRILARADLEERAESVLRGFSAELSRAPSAHAFGALAVDFAAGPSFEVVVAGRRGAADTEAMLGALRREYLPQAVVVFRPDGEVRPAIAELAPYTAAQVAVSGRATAYVCREYACRAPTSDLAEVLRVLRAPVEELEGSGGE